MYEVPRAQNARGFEVVLVPRDLTMHGLKNHILDIKDDAIAENMRLWKVWKPEDIDKFYNEICIEFSNYDSIRFDGRLYKDNNED